MSINILSINIKFFAVWDQFSGAGAGTTAISSFYGEKAYFAARSAKYDDKRAKFKMVKIKLYLITKTWIDSKGSL